MAASVAAKNRALFTHRTAGCLGRWVGPDAVAKEFLSQPGVDVQSFSL